MAIPERIRIIHALIRKITRHQEAFKTSARVNTVSFLFFFYSKSVALRRIFIIEIEIVFFLSHSSGAPVYISNPHFYLADPDLLDAVDGLTPNQSLHETYFKIQPVSRHQTNPFFIRFTLVDDFYLTFLLFLFLFILFTLRQHFHFVCESFYLHRNWASHWKEKCEYN